MKGLLVLVMILLATPYAGATSELDPFDPRVEETLREFDKVYEEETGESPWLFENPADGLFAPTCFRDSCTVWAQIVKSEQTLYLYLNGELATSWLVSTGLRQHETPRFDRHPNGRVYTKYTSRSYPEGDYMGLGNMPYAVFIQGGFALHGTPEGNWRKLGKRASHGCIRQHPADAKYFNDLVRQVGVRNVWITVQ